MFEKSFVCLEKITILSGQLGDFTKSKKTLEELLKKQEKAGRNEVDDAIKSITDFAINLTDKQKADSIIKIIFDFLKSNSKAIWLNQCINLGTIYLNQGEINLLEKLIIEVKETFTKSDGSLDKTQEGLLEVLALEI